jgi:putative transposase
VKRRKRHAMVDTDGRPLVLQLSAASVQDRDGAVPLLQASRRSFPFIERAFAVTLRWRPPCAARV